MRKIGKEELNKILEKHKLWLENPETGEYANLRGADLQRANLLGANLWGADLRGANLQYANLRGANLQYADLQRADLQYADLRGAYLQRADLQYANLQYADLDYSCLSLSCKIIGLVLDERLVQQLLYHVCAAKCDSTEWEELREQILPFVNKSHLIDKHGLPRLT